MRLETFRIKNYKSVKDTGECRMASDLTVLIGRNESGKSAILQALRDFDRRVERIEDSVWPIDADHGPEMQLRFSLSSEELAAIQQESGQSLPEDIAARITAEGLVLIKNAVGEYRLGHPEIDQLLEQDSGTRGQETLARIRGVSGQIQELLRGQGLPEFDFDRYISDDGVRAPELVAAIKGILPTVKGDEAQQRILELIRAIIEETRGLQTSTPRARFLNAACRCLPEFIFFSEFVEVLPFEVELRRLKDNEAVCDFAKISGLDLDELINITDTQRRINLLSRHSARIGGDFGNYWDQNKIELIARSEGEKILFGVMEEKRFELFKVEQRSKGFQWFLAFYLKLNARKGRDVVILIDEPGMHLHGKAQKDILAVLEQKIAPEARVVFSTHSPYLIDTNRLDRVRVIIKDPEAGTQVREDVRGCCDAEPLLPVETALGRDVPRAGGEGKRQLVVRGLTDYFFIQAMQEYMYSATLKGINFIPADEADKIPVMVSMLIGSDTEFRVLLNTDEEGKRIGAGLKERFLLEDERIIYVSEAPGTRVEDLFTADDFRNLVLPQGSVDDAAASNAQRLSASGMNPVVVAKEFLQKVRSSQAGVISKETQAAFKDVFDRIAAGFRDTGYTEKELQDENLIPR